MNLSPILLDSCGLIWWTLDQKKLSKKALLKINEQLEQNKNLLTSSITIWEIGLKIKQQKLDIGMSMEEYLDGLYKMGTIEMIPVDETIWLENLALSWKHRDPCDRTIVATAKLWKAHLITSDANIRKFYKSCIW